VDYKELYTEIGSMRTVLSKTLDQIQPANSGEFRDRVCEALDSLEEAQRELIRLEVEDNWNSR